MGVFAVILVLFVVFFFFFFVFRVQNFLLSTNTKWETCRTWEEKVTRIYGFYFRFLFLFLFMFMFLFLFLFLLLYLFLFLFFRYIVANYHNLPEVVVFSQSDFSDHHWMWDKHGLPRSACPSEVLVAEAKAAEKHGYLCCCCFCFYYRCSCSCSWYIFIFFPLF